MRHILAALALAGALSLVLAPAGARWKPEYASASPQVQAWYQNAELTEAARARFGFRKCCAHSDVVKTKFRVDRSSGADAWEWLDGETWRRVPPDIIHWGEHAPGGQPTLFVYDGKETCFFPGEDGQ